VKGAPPPRVTMPNLVVLGQTVPAYVRRKNWAHRFQPFKITQGHWNRHGSISCLLRPKFANFSHPSVLRTPAMGFLLELCNSGVALSYS